MTRRNYGLDLLRLFLMTGVVILHINFFSRDPEYTFGEFSLPALLLEYVCYCAVDGFAVLSGYVGFDSVYRPKRYVPLYMTVLLYNVLAAAAVHILGIVSFTYMAPDDITSHLLPLAGSTHWFFTAYTVLFLLIPLISSAVHNTAPKALCFSFLSALLLFMVSGIFFNSDDFWLGSGYSPVWIIMMYTLGAVLKRFSIADKLRTRTWFIIFAAASVSGWLISILLRFMTDNGLIYNFDPFYLLSYLSPVSVIQGVCLVMGFSKLELSEKGCRITAFLAPHAFSVYIIHSTPFVWELIMKKRFTWISELPTALTVPCVIVCAAAVFFICIIIDIPRAWLFGKAAALTGSISLPGQGRK